MFFLCLFVLPVLMGAAFSVVWIGMQLRIRGELRRIEDGDAVLTTPQLRALNATAASVAGIGGMLGVAPAVVVAFVLIQEPYLDGYAWLAMGPPAISAVVGGVLFAAGLVMYATNVGQIGEGE